MRTTHAAVTLMACLALAACGSGAAPTADSETEPAASLQGAASTADPVTDASADAPPAGSEASASAPGLDALMRPDIISAQEDLSGKTFIPLPDDMPEGPYIPEDYTVVSSRRERMPNGGEGIDVTLITAQPRVLVFSEVQVFAKSNGWRVKLAGDPQLTMHTWENDTKELNVYINDGSGAHKGKVFLRYTVIPK